MKPRDGKPHVRGGALAPLLKTGCAETMRTIQKTLFKPTLVSSPLALNPKAIIKAVRRGTTIPAENVSSLVFDATALQYSLSVDIPDSKVPKESLSSTQDGYLNTPSHLWRDVSCLADYTQRASKRLRPISICMERSQSSRNSIATTPSSFNRPTRPLLSCFQSGLSFSSPAQGEIVP